MKESVKINFCIEKPALDLNYIKKKLDIITIIKY